MIPEGENTVAANQSLVVYRARPEECGQGAVWNKDHGLLFIPEGWEFLPPGDAFVTGTVKKRGPVWVLKKKDRKRRLTLTLGLYAPGENIRKAEMWASQTADRRAVARKKDAARRAKHEERYRATFRQAVLDYLDFATKYAALAGRIADAVVSHACPVGSGTVARAQKLELKERVGLAVSAHLQHRYTDYDDKLFDCALATGQLDQVDNDGRRLLKQQAHWKVEQFIEKHRR